MPALEIAGIAGIAGRDRSIGRTYGDSTLPATFDGWQDAGSNYQPAGFSRPVEGIGGGGVIPHPARTERI